MNHHRAVRRLLYAAFAMLACEGASSVAYANGRFPAANQLVVAPSDPNRMMLRTTYGVMLSEDHGVNWDWMCEGGIGYGGIEDPSIGITENGNLVAGLFEGLSLARDRGCNWTFDGAALKAQVVVDLTIRPDTPAQALAITGSYNTATGSRTNQIFQSTDNAQTWSPLGVTLAEDLLVETVEVAKSDPQRLYVSSIRGQGKTFQALVHVSRDSGASFEDHALVIAEGQEEVPYVSAVDPKNADRVYVRTHTALLSRLLVSDDGGTTFREAYSSASPILGFALSGDGSEVWIGTLDGLFHADSAALTWTQRSSIQIQCLAWTEDRLYACSSESSAHFILGASADGGITFSPLLGLASLRGPLQCTGSSSTKSKCDPLWPAMREFLGAGGVTTDAGPSDAGPANTTTNMSAGGCTLAPPTQGALGLFALAGAIALARKRKKRPT